MTFPLITFDITIRRGHCRMAGIVSDMLPRARSNILRNTRVAQPMDSGFPEIRGVVLQSVLAHAIIGVIARFVR